MTPTQPRRPAPRPPRLALIGSFVAGLAVNTISDAYPGAAPTAVGLAVFFVAAVPLELRRRWDAQGVADAGPRGHWGMSALARGVAPRAGTDPRPQLYVRAARFNTRF